VRGTADPDELDLDISDLEEGGDGAGEPDQE